MPRSPLRAALQHLRLLFPQADDGDCSDAALLAQYTAHRDEAAFTALVERHGPLVRRVCCQVALQAHDADDAFQATFLILARKAAAVRRGASLAGWLYRVAYHAALQTRSRAECQRRRERAVVRVIHSEEAPPMEREELTPLLHEEVARLATRYRLPVLLCYLGERTNEQAAQELGLPVGTVKIRLSRARELLRGRLARRGVGLSAAAVATALAGEAHAALPAPLMRATIQAALAFLAGPARDETPSAAAVLAERVLRTMWITQCKGAAAVALLIGTLALGAGIVYGVLAAPASMPVPLLAKGVATPAVAAGDPGAAELADLHGDPLPNGVLVRMGTVRWRHPGAVNFVGYAKNGKQVVTGCQDRLFRVWEAATGKELRRFGPFQPGYTRPGSVTQGDGGLMMDGAVIHSGVAALAPDGAILAALSPDGVTRLWDVNTGKSLLALTDAQGGHALGSAGIAFSPDGETVAVRGDDQGIRLYGVGDGKEFRVVARPPQAQKGAVFSHASAGNNMTFSPDGKSLAVVGLTLENNQQRGIIHFHDLEGVQRFRQLKGPRNAGSGTVAFAPDGKSTAWPTADGFIRLLESDSGKELKEFGRGSGSSALLFSPDGKTIASRPTSGGAIQIWDVEKGKLARVMDEQAVGQQFGAVSIPHPAHALAFSPDGAALAEGLQNNSVRLWDVATGKETLPANGHQGGISSLAVAPDGKTLTTLAADRTIRQWDMATGKELHQFKLPSPWLSALVSADGQLVVTGAPNNIVKLWDAATGKGLLTVSNPSQQRLGGGAAGPLPAPDLALSPDGRTLAVRTHDHATAFYETLTGKETAVVSETAVVCHDPMTFSPDGNVLAMLSDSETGSSDRISLWHAQSGKLGTVLEATRGVTAATLSPDGRTIVTANKDRTISFWEIYTGKEFLTIKLAPPGESNPPADENGPGAARRLGGIGRSGELQGTSDRLTGSIASIAIAPDGRTLAVAGTDKSIRLFALPTGKELGAFTGHAGAVLSVRFAPDSKTVVSGSSDTTAMVWAGDRLLKKATTPAVPLEAQQLERLWHELAGEPRDAYKALITLAAAPARTLALFRDRVTPTAHLDAKQVDKLIADLDSDQFEVREKATAGLIKHGDLAQPALRKALDNQPPLDTRQRVEHLLEQLTIGQTPSAEMLRNIRAVMLLELMGSPEAKQVLQKVAQGAPGDKLTRQAEGALMRLGR